MLSLFDALPTFDRVFDDVMRETFSAFASPETYGAGVDVRESEDMLAMDFDVPGVKAEDLSVEIENHVLRVRGERKNKNGDAGKRTASFVWAYTIPDGYDVDQMKASLEDGVLTVEIPRHPKAKPRKIQVLASKASPQQLGEGQEQPKKAE